MQGWEEVSTLALVQLTQQFLVFLRFKVNPEETGDLILQVRRKTPFFVQAKLHRYCRTFTALPFDIIIAKFLSRNWLLDHLSPNIHIQILQTDLYTFP